MQIIAYFCGMYKCFYDKSQCDSSFESSGRDKTIVMKNRAKYRKSVYVSCVIIQHAGRVVFAILPA